MATLTLPTNISPVGPTGYQQLGVATFSTAVQNDTYVDIKTNIPGNIPGNGIMCMVEAVGYAYASQQAIRCAWTFYQWNDALYRVSVQNCYPGMSASDVYISGDGYVCLKAAVASYFLGFVLNVYAGNVESAGTKLSVTQINTSTISGHFY